MPLRLAILEADTPQPKTTAKYGGYTGVFTSLLRAATSPTPLDSLLTIKGYNIVDNPDSYPSLDEIDAILISGSKHSAYLDDPWILRLTEYTKQAIEGGRVRVVGICFGHQIVGRALGVRVEQSGRGWEVSVLEVELTGRGREVLGMERMRIHQMHRDEVVNFPPGSIPLGRTDMCPVQGMYVPGRYITIQGHPEFNEEIVREIVEVRHRGGVFDDTMYEDAMNRVGLEQDGVAIARSFVKFLLAGSDQ